MRSAPVMTRSMRFSFMTWAAMLSQMSVTSMPRCASSQGVRRGPWDSRRAAHAESANRFPDLLNGTAIAILDLRGEHRLIEKAYKAVGMADPGDGAMGAGCILHNHSF